MLKQIPFTDYDFWAYLSAGFLLLFAIDQATGFHWLLRESWTAVQGIIAVSLAYAVGHLCAGLSSFVLERGFIRRGVGAPEEVLFGRVKVPPPVLRWLALEYFQPLSMEAQQRVLEKAAKHNITEPGRAMFALAFTSVKLNSTVKGRLDNFLNQYGFCRNTALVAFLDAGILYTGYLQPHGKVELLYATWGALVLGGGMVMRYMKFYRHYSWELFTSFAFIDEVS